MESATRLLFLRHAEVDDAYHRVFGGRIDMSISALGLQQAQALADYIDRKFRLDAIYASPMKRVQMTLSPLLTRVRLEPVIVDGLREVDFGSWTGLRWEQISERFGVTAFDWLEHLERGTMPEAEPVELFRGRVERALAGILADNLGRTVAIACHGGVIRMALSVLLNLPLHKLSHAEIEYASLTWVDCCGPRREIQIQNLTPWRDL